MSFTDTGDKNGTGFVLIEVPSDLLVFINRP